jgi:hypothetical protein
VSTLPAIAQRAEATVKIASPHMKIRLRPSRSASLPPASRKAAKTML